jgi:hypothetical protein
MLSLDSGEPKGYQEAMRGMVKHAVEVSNAKQNRNFNKRKFGLSSIEMK